MRSNAEDYHLVLMDVPMPDMDGFAAIQVIRHQLCMTLPILAMTVGLLETDRHTCLEAGMNNFTAKPIECPEMLATIQSRAAASPASTRAFKVSHLMSADVVGPQHQCRLNVLFASTLPGVIEHAATAHRHSEAGCLDDLAL
nr:response regulator [uncultured Duganella sp.]